MSDSLGARLIELRETVGFNQKEISEIINQFQGRYSEYERDMRNPSNKLLKLLRAKLKVNTNWLLTGDGNMFQGDDKISDEAVLQVYKNIQENIIVHFIFIIYAKQKERFEDIITEMEEFFKLPTSKQKKIIKEAGYTDWEDLGSVELPALDVKTEEENKIIRRYRKSKLFRKYVNMLESKSEEQLKGLDGFLKD